MNPEPKYPIGGYAPGNYYNHCTTCKHQYQGDKRSWECEPCGTKSQAEWNALTPEQQEERVKRNAEAWKEFVTSKEYMKHNLEQQLRVGTSIKIGKQYAEEIGGFEVGQVITLVEGTFEYDNGLYVQNQITPAIWNEDANEFDSIYHLFGNDLENWYDCEILKPNDNDTTGTNKG